MALLPPPALAETTPLFDATFVVIDLETTGLRPYADRITEVGAVKVRRGDRIGEFQTLVSPGRSIPAGVSRLTGITDELVREHPPLEAVLPTLLEFLRGSAIVAHNARFDLRFLQANLTRLEYPGLTNPVIDTARLARRVLEAGEVRDHRLATLAEYLHARVKPTHRALSDARATVDVFHGLLERVGSLGVRTVEDLREYCRSSSDDAYRKVDLVAAAPASPGTYRFVGRNGEVLYIGKATNLRRRLRQYFGQDRRKRIADLVRDTVEVSWKPVPTELEAAVREVRAIHLHRPRYNSRSRHPGRAVYVKLTRELFPRLSVVTAVRDERCLHVGPFVSRRHAERFVAAIHDALPLRQCTDRLSTSRGRAPCLLKDMDRCGAPCDGTQSADSYETIVETYRSAILDDPSPLLDRLRDRMRRQASHGSFEAAGRTRTRLHHLALSLRAQRDVAALLRTEVLVACRVTGEHVEIVRAQRGRLSGTRTVARDDDAALAAADLAATAAPVPAPGPPARDEVEEIRLVARWTARADVRVLDVTGAYAEPAAGGRRLFQAVSELRRVDRAVHRDRDVLAGRKVVRRR